MLRAVSVNESRTITQVEGCPAAPGQIHIHAGSDSIALIVVEEEIRIFGRRKVRQPARNSAEALCILMRVGQVPLCASGDPWRSGRSFPAMNARARDRQREKDV